MSFSTSLQQFLEKKQHEIQTSRVLEKAFIKLHEGYTSGTHVTMPLRSYEEMIAYTIVRRPATLAAILKVLDRLEKRVPNHPFASCLDIGSGPLTAVEALANRYSDSLRRVDCIESHPLFCQFIEDANYSIGKDEENNVSLSLHKGNMSDASVWQKISSDELYDVAIASYSIGELSSSEVPLVLQRIAKSSKLAIIIEPGTPRGWKTMLQARDYFIGTENWRIIAPCPHEKECPLLRHEGVWCHESVRVGRSKEHRMLKGGLLGYEDEPFTYLIASRSEMNTLENIRRAIHRPQHRSGHSHLTLCCEDGLLREEIASKKNKELYNSVKKLEWGDSISTSLFSKENKKEGEY